MSAAILTFEHDSPCPCKGCKGKKRLICARYSQVCLTYRSCRACEFAGKDLGGQECPLEEDDKQQQPCKGVIYHA